ncbi:MAG: spinster family MFS transporter [Gammaproteobacteria bacterium]
MTIAYVFSFIDRTILALLVDPIKADLGLSDTQIGLLGGFAFAIFYTLMGLPIGWLADRKRRTFIIAGGIFVWSLMTAACGLAKNFGQLILARIGVGVGEAALSPPAYSMIADYFPPNRLGRPLGVYSSGVFIGTALAFILGGALVQYFTRLDSLALPLVGAVAPWQMAFVAVGLPGLLVAALMLTITEPVRRGVQQTDGNLRALWQWMGQHRGALAAHMFGFAIIGMPLQAVFLWAPSFYIRNFQYSFGEAGLALGVLALIFGGGGMFAGGWLTDWLRNRGHRDAALRVGMVGAVGAAPFALSAGLAGTPVLATVLLAPMIFFASCSLGAAPTALQLITPNRYRAQVSAVYLLVLNLIATGAAPWIVGFATDYLFKDPLAVGQSMALVGIAAPLAVAIFWLGLPAYRKAT